jgi:hypothetical protein
MKLDKLLKIAGIDRELIKESNEADTDTLYPTDNRNWETTYRKLKQLDSESMNKLFQSEIAKERPDVAIINVISQWVDPEYLLLGIKKRFEVVRLNAAQRINPKHLPLMINDPSVEVRSEVVERIDPEHLHKFIFDEHDYIATKAVIRMKELGIFDGHEDDWEKAKILQIRRDLKKPKSFWDW